MVRSGGDGPARLRPAAAVAYVVVVTAWLAWLIWLPGRLAAGPVPPGLSVMAVASGAAAGLVCHQLPRRSFSTAGVPWLVCARCAGLYAGGAAGGWLALGAWALSARVRHGVSRRAARFGLLAASAPTAVLWLVERVGVAETSHLVRSVGAVPLGAAVSAVVVLAIVGVPLTDAGRPGLSRA